MWYFTLYLFGHSSWTAASDIHTLTYCNVVFQGIVSVIFDRVLGVGGIEVATFSLYDQCQIIFTASSREHIIEAHFWSSLFMMMITDVTLHPVLPCEASIALSMDLQAICNWKHLKLMLSAFSVLSEREQHQPSGACCCVLHQPVCCRSLHPHQLQ